MSDAPRDSAGTVRSKRGAHARYDSTRRLFERCALPLVGGGGGGGGVPEPELVGYAQKVHERRTQVASR